MHSEERTTPDVESAEPEVCYTVNHCGFLIPNEGVSDEEFAKQIYALNQKLIYGDDA